MVFYYVIGMMFVNKSYSDENICHMEFFVTVYCVLLGEVSKTLGLYHPFL